MIQTLLTFKPCFLYHEQAQVYVIYAYNSEHMHTHMFTLLPCIHSQMHRVKEMTKQSQPSNATTHRLPYPPSLTTFPIPELHPLTPNPSQPHTSIHVHGRTGSRLGHH